MIRFGLLGFGAIGQFRAASLLQTPGAALTVICERDEKLLAVAASKYKVVTTSKYEDMLSRDDVDVIIVSTPPNLHREHCEAAFTHNKHVLCEKPIATNVEDAQKMVEAAEKAGRVLGTGFNYRFYPAIAKIRAIINAGEIGDIDHIRSFAGHPGGPEFTHPWVHRPEIMGGGALMDNGIHVIDLSLHFLGKPTESMGMATDHTWLFGQSEDNGFLLMRNDKGNVASVQASWTEWRGYQFNVEVYGTEGCVRASYPPMFCSLRKKPVGSAKRGRKKNFWFPVFQVNERLKSYRWTIVESFIAEQRDFILRIGGEIGVGATGMDGLYAVKAAQSAVHLSRVE